MLRIYNSQKSKYKWSTKMKGCSNQRNANESKNEM